MDSNNQMNNNIQQIDLIKLLFTFIHRWWVFAITCTVAGIVATIYTLYFITPLYQSSVSIFINNRQNTSTSSEYISSSDISTARNLVKTYLAVASSDKVMTAVAEELGGSYNAAMLKGSISARQVNETELISITVTTTDPEEAARIANAVAVVFPDQIAEIIEGSSAKVIDYAKVPLTKSYPVNTTNVITGIMLGAALGAIIVIIEYFADVRIKDSDDLTALSDYPILGHIPDFSTIGVKGSHSRYGYTNAYSQSSEDKEKK